jgi:hypothetical protein
MGTVTADSFVGPLTGNASTATALQTARTINGISFDGTGNITITAAANTLTASELASGVTSSSLTSLGTIASLVATTADINGGTIDDAVIGGNSAAAGTFTTLTSASLDVDQGAADTNILTLGSSDVAHGMTVYTATDNFMFVEKLSATTGGAWVVGLGEATKGIQFEGASTTGDTGKTNAATAPVEILGRKANGTTTQTMGANENILVVGYEHSLHYRR